MTSSAPPQGTLAPPYVSEGRWSASRSREARRAFLSRLGSALAGRMPLRAARRIEQQTHEVFARLAGYLHTLNMSESVEQMGSRLFKASFDGTTTFGDAAVGGGDPFHRVGDG